MQSHRAHIASVLPILRRKSLRMNFSPPFRRSRSRPPSPRRRHRRPHRHCRRRRRQPRPPQQRRHPATRPPPIRMPSPTSFSPSCTMSSSSASNCCGSVAACRLRRRSRRSRPPKTTTKTSNWARPSGDRRKPRKPPCVRRDRRAGNAVDRPATMSRCRLTTAPTRLASRW